MDDLEKLFEQSTRQQQQPMSLLKASGMLLAFTFTVCIGLLMLIGVAWIGKQVLF